jgi:hypothetical protein
MAWRATRDDGRDDTLIVSRRHADPRQSETNSVPLSLAFFSVPLCLREILSLRANII